MVEDARLLKQMALFKELDAMEMIQVSRVVSQRKVKKGGTVVVEDETASALFIIKDGTFEVTREINGEKKILGTLGRSDHFGEISLIDNKPRSATVRALEDSLVLVIERESFEQILSYSTEMERKLNHAFLLDMCHKLRRTNDYYILAL